jgi:hypothetical protein
MKQHFHASVGANELRLLLLRALVRCDAANFFYGRLETLADREKGRDAVLLIERIYEDRVKDLTTPVSVCNTTQL